MRVSNVRRSVFVGAAVFACLLVSQGALGVIADRSRVGAGACGDPLDGDGDWGFSAGGVGPNLGSFQASYAGSAVKDGASASASAFVDFILSTNAEAGTIAGTFAGAAACEFTGGEVGSGWSDVGASLSLGFSVPEGQQGIYRLRGSIQGSGGSGTLLLRDWDPTMGEFEYLVSVNSYPGGPFDLSGVLAPGFYELSASAMGEVSLWGAGTVREAASINLDFSIVPEPATVASLLILAAGGLIVRRRR